MPWICLVVFFLWFRSSAGFVIGEVTGILLGPFLFNSTFFLGVGDCLYIYIYIGRGICGAFCLELLWRHTCIWTRCVFILCEAILAVETELVWASPTEVGLWASPTGVELWALPTGVVLWALPTGVVFWTPTKGVVRVGTSHHGLF